MIAWLLSFLSGPLLNGLVGAYKAKLEAGNTHDRIAADLAGRELEVQKAEIQAQAQLRIAQVGKWWEPEKLMGYTVAIYFAKVVIWDKVLKLGTTDELLGWTGITASLIVGCYFGKRGIENAIKIWRAK